MSPICSMFVQPGDLFMVSNRSLVVNTCIYIADIIMFSNLTTQNITFGLSSLSLSGTTSTCPSIWPELTQLLAHSTGGDTKYAAAAAATWGIFVTNIHQVSLHFSVKTEMGPENGRHIQDCHAQSPGPGDCAWRGG